MALARKRDAGAAGALYAGYRHSSEPLVACPREDMNSSSGVIDRWPDNLDRAPPTIAGTTIRRFWYCALFLSSIVNCGTPEAIYKSSFRRVVAFLCPYSSVTADSTPIELLTTPLIRSVVAVCSTGS